MNKNELVVAAVAAVLGFGSASVFAQIDIDNGISGDGFWQVSSDDAGSSSNGVIDPTGPDGPTDVIYYFSPYYDNGLDGPDGELLDNVTTPVMSVNSNTVTSSGTFPGPNGSISWTATASIAPGSPLYNVQYQFSSASAFGNTRIITYFDEDVAGAGNDVVVVFGTPGADDFQLLTVDANVNVGVSLAGAYSSAVNMTYAGWAIDDCCTVPSVFSIPGELGTLTPYNDPRYPANDVYGPPQDVTTSMAFDFNPLATSASFTVALGGSPDATPPPPPIEPPPPPPAATTPIPVMPYWALMATMLLLMVIGRSGMRRLIK